MATWYVDLEGSAGAGDGTSFADRSSALATIVNASAAGDTIRVKQTTPTSIGSATWTKNGNIVGSATLTKEIYNDGAWTAATNVTCAATTSTSVRKQGASSASFVFATAFTTGRAAHYAVGGTQDYSGYTKVSFWLRTTVAITNASIYQIKLCSDAGGTTAVDTLTLPAMYIPINSFIPIVLDNGGALGSSIQSVALYTTADPGTPTLYIDNMFATNDVTLRTLISTDSVGQVAVGSGWHAIRAITNGGDIEIDVAPSSAISAVPKGYPGETGSYTTYVSDGVFPSGLSYQTATTTYLFSFTKAGTDGSPVTISGGWNATDMSTRTGLTHVNNQNMQGRGMIMSGVYQVLENFILSHTGGNTLAFNANNLSFNNIFIVGNAGNNSIVIGTRTFQTMTNCYGAHGGAGLTSGVRVSTWSGCVATNNASFGMNGWGTASTVTSCSGVNNNDSAFYSITTDNTVFTDCVAINNTYSAEFGDARNITFNNFIALSGSSYAVYFLNGSNINFYNLTTSGNALGGFQAIGSQQFNVYGWNRSEANATNVFADYLNAVVISINENHTPDNHILYFDGGRVQSDTGVRHTATGISWKMQPTSAARDSYYPLKSNIKAIPIKANVEHTASVWVRRDNTGLSMQFVMPDQGVSGLSGMSTSMTGTANTWEQLSLTFTPLEDAVIDFYVGAYGGTTYNGYWDDFSITAASKLDVAEGDYAYPAFGAYATSYPEGSGSPTPTETSYVFAC